MLFWCTETVFTYINGIWYDIDVIKYYMGKYWTQFSGLRFCRTKKVSFFLSVCSIVRWLQIWILTLPQPSMFRSQERAKLTMLSGKKGQCYSQPVNPSNSSQIMRIRSVFPLSVCCPFIILEWLFKIDIKRKPPQKSYSHYNAMPLKGCQLDLQEQLRRCLIFIVDSNRVCISNFSYISRM